MKERFLEVVYICITFFILSISGLSMVVLTPLFPFIYIITGKNIYEGIQKLYDKILDKIGINF